MTYNVKLPICSRFLCSFILFVLSQGYCEDTARLLVDGNKAKEYITHLSKDSFQGRQSCTEGYRKAADWVASQFKAFGLKPAGEKGTYFQKVPIRGFTWREGVPALNVKGREFLFDDADFSVHPASTCATKVEGEIVFAGYGISAPGKGLDEYKDLDVKGKVVLVFSGSPNTVSPLRSMLNSFKIENSGKKDEWKEESTIEKKIKTAYSRGAEAVLFFDPESFGQRRDGYRRGSRKKTSFTAERKFLVFTIQERIFRAIMKKDPQESPRGLGRRMNTLQLEIRDKKTHSFATGVTACLKGYDVKVEHSEKNKNNIARNVLGKIEGTDPELKKQFIMIGAHLDHIGMRNGYVYNGADDNASGSGVVMEVARVLSENGYKPERTIIFCAWCGEELGLIGSTFFAKNPCDGVTLNQIAAHFNLDMVGLGENISAFGALNFPSIWEVIKRGQDKKIMGVIKPGTGRTGGSDHSAFIRKGITTLFLITRDGHGHPDYHQPEDDAEKMDPEMLRKTGQFALQAIMNLDVETSINLLVENREKLYNAIWVKIGNYNPDVSGSSWTCETIKIKGKDALYDEMLKKAGEIIKSLGKSSRSSTRSRSNLPQGGKSSARGVTGLESFEGSTDLLKAVMDFYGYGRIDIKGDDGIWIVKGRLTDPGKEAVRFMEKEGYVIRLVSPKEDLINDMLSVSSKPFIITGKYSITESMVRTVNSKNILLGVDCDPKKIDDFVTRVEALKEFLGQRKNLFIFLTSTKGLDDVKQSLYMALSKKGWGHKEICGDERRMGGLFLGDFSILKK